MAGKGPHQEMVSPSASEDLAGNNVAISVQPDASSSGFLYNLCGARQWHNTDDMRMDARVSNTQRVIEYTKDVYEMYVASNAPGARSPWKARFDGRSVFFTPLLAPWGQSYQLWYLLILVLDLIYTAFVFPYNEAWRTQSFAMYCVEAVFGLLFIMDVVINLHVPYVLRFKNDKMLVYNGLQLFYLYLTEDTFVVDAITAVTFFVVTISVLNPNVGTTSSVWGYVRAIRLLRLYRIYLITKQLILGTWVHQFVAVRWAANLISVRSMYVLGMAYCACVLINLLACLWWFVGYYPNDDPEETWPYVAGGVGDITNAPSWRQYVTSMYYVVTTITTTGYGDITPQNTLEQIFAMVVMACGALFFAFLIGSVVGQIMQSGAAARRAAKFKEKIQVVEQFLTTNCVSKRLHNKIFRFYSDVWVRQQEEEELWSGVDDLGPTIKSQLLVEMVGPYVRALGPFKSLSDLAMLALSGLLEPLPLAPEMDICKNGDPADCLWILQEGSVAQLKGEKQVSGPIWAPGLLGLDSLTHVLAQRRALQGEVLREAQGQDEDPYHARAAASPVGASGAGAAGPGGGRVGSSTAAPVADSGRGAPSTIHETGSAVEVGAAGAEAAAAAAAAQPQASAAGGAAEQAVQTFTLRTLRTCTLFRLSVPKLMALLDNIDPWEAYEIESGLCAAVGLQGEGEVLGHASRTAVRAASKHKGGADGRAGSSKPGSKHANGSSSLPASSTSAKHSSLLKRGAVVMRTILAPAGSNASNGVGAAVASTASGAAERGGSMRPVSPSANSR